MHPLIEQDHAGNCPICGMALEPKNITAADEEGNTELDDMTRRFWIGGECLTKSPLHLQPVPSPKNGLDCFTVLSTVWRKFAAKLRNWVKRCENELGDCHL
jgi:Heavy metal binding domain